MKVQLLAACVMALMSVSLCSCARETQAHQEEHHKIVATSPQLRPVTITERYVCQIHSQRHIDVRALEQGYLEEIQIKEGQHVTEGAALFDVRPILYESKVEAENAEARLALLEYNNTKRLFDQKVVSKNELLLLEAKLHKAQAKAKLAKAELDFATVKAPFDGIVDRLRHQQGSLVQEGEVLTTLSDNSTMWVYFNVPEARYLEYMGSQDKDKKLTIELELANFNKFDHIGKIGAIEADFNNKTGNISFRADFPNPDNLLRHGQTGTILISHVQPDAVVVPQRATFPILQKRYVYVIDDDNVVHQREIVPAEELEDEFIIKSGVGVGERIVLEGIRQVHDGDHVEFESRRPDEVAANLKYHAE